MHLLKNLVHVSMVRMHANVAKFLVIETEIFLSQ